MRRIVAAAAAGAALLATTTACDDSEAAKPHPQPSTTVETPPESTVAQHETGAESPIGFGLSVPDGATQLGPLIRRRSPELLKAYEKVLKRYERKLARERAKEARENGEETPTEPTPSPSPFPTEDTFGELDRPPEPDITTALLRVDENPGEVFADVLEQIASVLPGLGVEPDQWSQFCHAKRGVYTGCKVSLSGRTVEDRGVRIEVTVDPGNVATKTAPAGSKKRPVMTITTESTDPIDTSDALEDDRPSPTPSTTPPSPASPSPVAPGTPVKAKWPTMTSTRPTGAGESLLTKKWTMREDSTLLLSGDDPAFAILVTDRRTNADAVARSRVLEYSGKGEPERDVVEDRTEIGVTYTARGSKHEPRVTATYVQAGRGNYIALFYDPPAKGRSASRDSR